jgi:Protein of unknown function (DUF3563)
MTDRVESKGLFETLRRWLWPATAHELYLAASADHADLERRMRALERVDRGSLFVTFNH